MARGTAVAYVCLAVVVSSLTFKDGLDNRYREHADGPWNDYSDIADPASAADAATDAATSAATPAEAAATGDPSFDGLIPPPPSGWEVAETKTQTDRPQNVERPSPPAPITYWAGGLWDALLVAIGFAVGYAVLWAIFRGLRWIARGFLDGEKTPAQ